MPRGVYERKPRTAKGGQTVTTTPKRKTRKIVTSSTPTRSVLKGDPNSTTEEWQELRYSEILEHPTWMPSTATLAQRNLQMAKARKIRRRTITRSQWEVID
jgi:hypothetical protein